MGVNQIYIVLNIFPSYVSGTLSIHPSVRPSVFSCTLLDNTGSQVMSNWDVIGQNIKAVLDARLSGHTSNIVLRKGWAMPVYICTVGKADGVADFGCTYTQYLFPSYKNKTLFLDVPMGKFGLSNDDDDDDDVMPSAVADGTAASVGSSSIEAKKEK